MIQVNEKKMEWKDNMKISDLFIFLGIENTVPSLIVVMNGILINKKKWDEIEIADNSKFHILKILHGG